MDIITGMVSCIIPVVKNDPYIEDCINSIKYQTYWNYEIIVVDEGLERSQQRNIGIRRARGEFILWIDADMRLSWFVLSGCVRAIKNCTALYIPEIITTKGWFGRVRNWERQFYNGSLVDVPRFIRKSDCPFFDEEQIGTEDSDWKNQVMYDNPRAIFDIIHSPFYHQDDISILQYFRKKAYYAKSLGVYKKKNPDDKLLTFKYRCWDVFTEKGKWKKFVSKPHYALAVIVMVFIRGIIFLTVPKR